MSSLLHLTVLYPSSHRAAIHTPYPSPSTMDPPNPRNEPLSSSRCFHLCCAVYSPSSSLKELSADPVAVITLVCLALLALKKNMNSSVAVTTWVGSDIFSSQLSVTIHSWSLYPPSQWMTHSPSLSPVTMMSTMSGWTSRAVSIGWYKRKVSGLGKRCNQNNLNIMCTNSNVNGHKGVLFCLNK